MSEGRCTSWLECRREAVATVTVTYLGRTLVLPVCPFHRHAYDAHNERGAA